MITLYNAERLYSGRKIIINAFKNKVFSIHKKQEHEDKDEDSPISKLENLINKKIREINEELIQKHFGHQDLNTMLENVENTKTQIEIKTLAQLQAGKNSEKFKNEKR